MEALAQNLEMRGSRIRILDTSRLPNPVCKDEEDAVGKGNLEGKLCSLYFVTIDDTVLGL